MYKVKFVTSNGTYYFDTSNFTVADFNVGDSVVTNYAESQGFGQTGTTIENRSVGSRTITCKGCIYNNISSSKKLLRKIINPLASGYLVFDNKYQIYVEVVHAPSFSPLKDDGRFTAEFIAPFPYFESTELNVVDTGTVAKSFQLPISNVKTFRFGTVVKSDNVYIYNNSDEEIPLRFFLKVNTATSNITVTDNEVRKLTLEGSFGTGDLIGIYRDANNFLQCRVIHNYPTGEIDINAFEENESENIISRISDDSDFFTLSVGGNDLKVIDPSAGANVSARFTYREVVTAYYED